MEGRAWHNLHELRLPERVARVALLTKTQRARQQLLRALIVNIVVDVDDQKNALFAGHDQGAENWACIASLIETCKLHGINPQAYFTDVLTKLVNLWPASRLDELMPWAWAAECSTYSLAA